MPRRVLAIVLVLGLAPSLGELVETVVHRAVDGHWAHTDPGHDGAPCGEHTCAATLHHCGCCSSTPLKPAPGGFDARLPASPRAFASAADAVAPADAPRAGPFRPPIA